MSKNKTKVAFQGEIGAYSEEAAFRFFGNYIETLPRRNLVDVFKAVEKNKVNFGIVPVENSLEGSIGETYDLLLDSKLKIFGETKLKISHCLIAHPGTKLRFVKKVYSHPQALGQCRKFLEKLHWEIIPTYDSAGSVKMIKEKELKDSAAIASQRAAKVYNMQILKKRIEINHQNFTRFFIISKREREPTGRDKTSIVFSTKHRPGALYKALGIFAVGDINLTKLESRPLIGKPWEYKFFLDFEGHQDEQKVKQALKALKKSTTFLKIIGSYPRAKLYV